MQNDILIEMDNDNVVLLVLLDLTPAFDTIDHEILLNKLSTRCGIGDNVLKWCHSYLIDYTQTVTLDLVIQHDNLLNIVFHKDLL